MRRPSCAVTTLVALILSPLIGPATAAAQAEAATLRITIVDRDELPLGGVQVLVMDAGRVLVRDAVSDAVGMVEIDRLAHGTYQVRAVGGPWAEIARVVDVRAGVVEITVTMVPAGISERIIITASHGIAQEQSKIPASIRVLDAVDLQARSLTMLPRMLDEEPGVLTQETTPGQGSPILRGQSAQSVLYLLDGVRYNNSTYRGGNTQYLAWIPSATVGSVEVLLGPAGVTYGSDALGGAVNVLTEPVPPFERDRVTPHASIRAFGESSTLGLGTDATVGLSSPRFAGYLTGNVAKHQDMRSGGGRDSHNVLVRYLGLDDGQVRTAFGARLRDTSFSQTGVSAKGSLQLGATGNLTGFFAHTTQSGVRRYDRLLGGDGRFRAEFDPQRLDFGYLSYQKVFPATFLESKISLNRQTDGRRDQRRTTSDLIQERNRVAAFGFETVVSRTFDRHLVTGGVELYDEHIDAVREETTPAGATTVVRPRFPDGSRYTSFGLFVLDEWTAVGGRLHLSTGARFSAFRFAADAADNVIDDVALVPDARETFSDLTFNAGATFQATESLGLYGRVARGFRAPSVFDLGEQGLTGGGFEVSPGEAVELQALIGRSSGGDALSTGMRWQPLDPEQLWSFEGGVRLQARTTRVELAAFDSELYDTLTRRVVIVDRPVVGQVIGGEAIVAQDDVGRIFVAVDRDPVVSRANVGRLRVWGVELLVQHSWEQHWLLSVKGALQRGTEVDTGLVARKIAPDNATASLRWTSDTGSLWIEGIVQGALAQDRFNPGDFEDARIGAFRDAGDIADFFTDDGPRLGLVQDGVLLATGETLDQVVSRVLGSSGMGAPLFRETPGWLAVGFRGSYAVTEDQTLMFAVDNLTDANYRLHGSGFDAAGINLSVSYTVDF